MRWLSFFSANTGTLAQIDRDRNVMAAKLLSLDQRYLVEFVESLARIRFEYRKLLVQYEQIERERQGLKRLYGIMAIHNEAFNSQKMAPVDHLRETYSYEQAINQYKRRKSELLIQLLEFQNLCRYQLPDRLLVPMADNDCPANQPRALSEATVDVSGYR